MSIIIFIILIIMDQSNFCINDWFILTEAKIMIEKMILFNILKTNVKTMIHNNSSVSVYDTYHLIKLYFYLFFLNMVINHPQFQCYKRCHLSCTSLFTSHSFGTIRSFFFINQCSLLQILCIKLQCACNVYSS